MTAFHCSSPVDFLDHIFQHHAGPGTIVICSSREVFLHHLDQSLHEHTAASEGNSILQHPLMTPTIHLLSTSKSINLAFTPTLPHLRAYLATLGPKDAVNPKTRTENHSTHTCSPLLALFGLIGIHRSTTEYSAQGISRSLSTAVEASVALGRKLIVAEIAPTIQEDNAVTATEEVADRREDLWAEQIPILNGSIGYGGDQRPWAGRTVELARVISRWCSIVRLDESSTD